MKERIWLTWESQRRNRTLSEALGAHLYELEFKTSRPRRWARSLVASLRILYRERPRHLFAQNPSLLLALLAVWYGRLTGAVTVIDAHNAGVFPFQGRKGWKQAALRRLMSAAARHVMRSARITLVSNPALARYVDSIGGCGFVLPDPLPRFAAGARSDTPGRPSVLFICTWAADEPYLEVIKAAARIDPGIRVLITGNSKGREFALQQPLPANVELTGFVPERRFVELLCAADVVMDLTTLDDCLVCGAYEAVAAGKPMVLSDTAALRSYFHQGAVFTRNDADSIAQAMEHAVADRARLGELAEALKQDLLESWDRRKHALETVLAQLADKAPVNQTIQKEGR